MNKFQAFHSQPNLDNFLFFKFPQKSFSSKLNSNLKRLKEGKYLK